MSGELAPEVAMMAGPAALPRDNGELVFDAPWQGRALAVAVTVTERLGLPWEEFRQRLIQAIAAEPGRPYYESWTAALERLLVEHGVTTSADIDAALPDERPAL